MRRFPRAADHFEALEPRCLQSAAPTPGDGNDYVMIVGDTGKPVVHATPEQVHRTPLPAGFTWFDVSPAQVASKVVPGILPVYVDDRAIYPTGPDGQSVTGTAIDEANTRRMARAVKPFGGILTLDIENWAMTVYNADQATVNQSVARFEQIITWCRDEVPSIKIGIYGNLPTSDYWSSEQMGWAEDVYATTGSYWHMYDVADAADMHAKWQAACNFVRSLADKVDYLFPSLYTFYNDEDGWTRSAKSVIDEARTLGKPVIPFLWPKYHDSNAMIDDAFWAHELDTVMTYADGGAIWNNTTYSGEDSWMRAVYDRRTTNTFSTQSLAAPADDGVGQTGVRRDDDDNATSSHAADLLAA